MPTSPDISIILATHNRRDVTLSTLHRLVALRTEFQIEIIVVDNASADETADAIATCLPAIKLILLDDNHGSCAKAYGADVASGEYLLFLDDDSYPLPNSIDQMVSRFSSNPKLGAAGFTVHLPDGRRESAALPHVFVGCGVGLRRGAYEDVGGLDRTYFMQAEEYDLCFRLMAGGWDVERFDDLHVDHLKTARSRISERTCFYDTRNNLLVTARYIPDAYEAIVREDVLQRYRWIVQSQGYIAANQHAESEALRRYDSERSRFAKYRLSAATFEKLFRYDEVTARMRNLHATGVRRIVLADLGKNIYPFVIGARQCGIELASIVDDNFARISRDYRGIGVVQSDAVSLDGIDAIVVSNMSPAHATRTLAQWSKRTDVPIHAWYAESPTLRRPSVVVPIEQAANSA